MIEEPLTDDLAGGEYTFDRTSIGGFQGRLGQENGEGDPKGSQQREGFCRNCSTQARMSGDSQSWSRTGVCNTSGCRGYAGHAPAGRPQGIDHEDGSDDVPLLFSPLGSSPASHSSQELDLVDHCHSAEPGRDASKSAIRQLSIAVVLCSVFVVGEILGGILSGSLAIMGDAAHMFSDLASFGLSLFVLWLGQKKPRKSMTFGFYRAEALGALATLVIIWYVTGILVYLAINRISTGNFELHGNAMLIVATCAVIFNIFLGLTLHGGLAICQMPHGHSHGGGHQHLGGHGHSHGSDIHGRQINIRAALIHVLGDLLQSIGVLISSLLIKLFGDSFKLADPICTLMFACVVVVTTIPVLRDTVIILMEGKPRAFDYDAIYENLLSVKEVHRVHSLHLWSLTADLPCMSVHLTTNPGADQEAIRAQTNKMLRTKYHIFRTTIQVEHHQAHVMSECERCQPLLV